MHRNFARLMLVSGAAAAMSACGGDGEHVAFIPPPPVAPAPAPAPTPTPTPSPTPIPPSRLGLTSTAPFAVLAVGDTYSNDNGSWTRLTPPASADVQFRYDSATNGYFITLPGYNPGTLVETQYGGSGGSPATSSTSKLQELSFGFVMPVSITLPVPGSAQSPLTYTSLGYWAGQLDSAQSGPKTYGEGIFAYGIPTAAGDVPVTGSASYAATIAGSMDAGTSNYNYLTGTANLKFDFGAGTLSGSMHPVVDDSFDGIFFDFSQYAFKQTIYSSGSTSFSGKFDVPGLPGADSGFDGQFTGPGAAELMARFVAPYLLGDKQGTLSGVWLGRKN